MQSVSEWVDAAGGPDLWLKINPALHVGGPGPTPLIDEHRLDGDDLRDWMIHEGYYQLGPLLGDERLSAMRGAVEALWRGGLPPVFAFVYDEFWHAGIWFRPLLSALLGPGFKQLPDFWAWMVRPSVGDSGWAPHRDKTFDTIDGDGLPKSLTIWVPLTHATTLNGCMYLLPASRDDAYQDRRLAHEVPRPQDVQALPAIAGSLLCWNQAVLHWGSRSNPRSREPRISFSIEYQRGELSPYNQPLLEPGVAPPLSTRLALIAKQILQYRHMYALAEDHLKLARALHARFA